MLGMSLLVCDTSFDLIIQNVLYHAPLVDQIVCIANNPSRLLLKQIEFLENSINNFKFLCSMNGDMTMDFQVQISTKMTNELKRIGCSWVIPCDDDEFYIGNIKNSLLEAEKNGCNALYQNGFCYYTTELDGKDLSPIRRFTWRDPDTFDYEYRKAIHNTQNFISMTPGNHWANFSVPYKPFKDPLLRINHYNHRKKNLFIHIKNTFAPLTAAQIQEKQLVQDNILIDIFNQRGLP